VCVTDSHNTPGYKEEIFKNGRQLPPGNPTFLPLTSPTTTVTGSFIMRLATELTQPGTVAENMSVCLSDGSSSKIPCT